MKDEIMNRNKERSGNRCGLRGGTGCGAWKPLARRLEPSKQGGAEAAKVHSIICSVRELHRIASLADRERARARQGLKIFNLPGKKRASLV